MNSMHKDSPEPAANRPGNKPKEFNILFIYHPSDCISRKAGVCEKEVSLHVRLRGVIRPALYKATTSSVEHLKI